MSAAQTPGGDACVTNYTSVNADAPTRPQSVVAQPDDKIFDACLTELLPFRLDETEVLLWRKIARSDYKTVWLGHYRDQSVAVKRLIDSHEYEVITFAREIRMTSQLVHPCIVRFIGCMWTNDKDISGVTEYMDGGDLHTLLANRKIDLSWRQEKIAMAIDIAQGLAYLHSLDPNVIHRSLNTCTVLLDTAMSAKLSGYDIARKYNIEQALPVSTFTLFWAAPELLLGEMHNEQSDVYALGVILSELDTREVPYEGSGESYMAITIQVAKGELRPSFAPDCPESILEIAHACLQYDPALRPSSDTIVKMLEDARIELQA